MSCAADVLILIVYFFCTHYAENADWPFKRLKPHARADKAPRAVFHQDALAVRGNEMNIGVVVFPYYFFSPPASAAGKFEIFNHPPAK